MKKTIYIYIFLVLSAFLISAPLKADEKKATPFEITTETDKNEVYVGDRIKLTLKVKDAKGYDLLFPETPEKTGDFTFVESYPIKSKLKKAPDTGRVYILTIFDTGTHVIPPIEIGYKKIDGGSWETAESSQISIEVKSLLTGTDIDIKDIKGLAAPRGRFAWPVLFAFLALSGALLGWRLWSMRKKQIEEEALRKKPPHEIAYEELRKLKMKNLPEKGLIKEYYTELSDIIRRYLEKRFSFRAPEMTTEEFLMSIKAAPMLTPDHKRLLKEFLESCDMVKFAKYGPTPLEMLDSFNAAERLVEQTALQEEEESEEEKK